MRGEVVVVHRPVAVGEKRAERLQAGDVGANEAVRGVRHKPVVQVVGKERGSFAYHAVNVLGRDLGMFADLAKRVACRLKAERVGCGRKSDRAVVRGNKFRGARFEVAFRGCFCDDLRGEVGKREASNNVGYSCALGSG